MRAVNLLPADRRDVKRGSGGSSSRKPLYALSGVVALAAVAGLSALVWTSNSSVKSKTTTLDALQSQIASLPAGQPASGATAAPDATTPARTGAIGSLVGSRLAWDKFFGALTTVMPEDVWLQNIAATTGGAAATIAAAQAAEEEAAAAAAVPSKPTSPPSTTAPPPAAAAPTANAFTMVGFTYGQPSVARVMRRLAIVPWLSDVSLVSTATSLIGNKSVVQFTIKATIVSTPKAA